MDKICIVRRRIQTPALPDIPPFCKQKDSEKINEFSSVSSLMPDGNSKQHIYPFRGALRDDDHVIRIQLTPDQCKVVQSNSSLNHFLGRILGEIDLDLEHYEDGQIVFNLHLKHVQRVNMLDSKGVCQMLQISRSFLSKLIKLEKIKSYKMGRLRRFLLEDILDYLSQGEVLQKTIERVPNKTRKILSEEQPGKLPVS